MKCEDVYLHICDHLDEDIQSERCRQIKRHLSTCPECSTYLATLKRTITLYKALPTPRIPAGAHRELFKTVSALTGPKGSRTKRQPRKTKRT